MTAVRAAGYSSTGAGWGASFDPLNQATRMGSAFHHKDENSVENRLKALWQRVLSLYEESVRAAQAGQAKLALDKAKECASKERTWSKHVLAGPTAIGASLTGSSNASAALELKLAVQVNLAAQYVRNGILSEAIRVYANICRNKQLPNAGRFRCNIGCILYAQGEYVPAIKMFRMALDQMPASNRLAR